MGKIPTWGAVMLISTFIAFLFAMFMIEYTFGRLVPTLVMIESPQDTISFEPLPTEDPDSTINKDPEQPSKPQLITSSIRRTVRHLGGFSSRFRGLSILAGLVDKDAQQIVDMKPSEKTAMSFKAIAILLFGVVLTFLVVIPANVTLTRVQASLLVDTEETIVPFDRSFGGKVVPEIVGGTGMIGMLDAWKTFDWAARIRLVKTYLKVIAMQIGVTFLFTMCIVSQLFIIAGKDWSKLIPEDGNKN